MIPKLSTSGAINSRVKHQQLYLFLWFYSQIQIGNFFITTVQNRRRSKTMETTSRRVLSNKQTEV